MLCLSIFSLIVSLYAFWKNQKTIITDIFRGYAIGIWAWYGLEKTMSGSLDLQKLQCIPLWHLTLSWRRPLSYRNQSIDLRSNQWTGFYMITAAVMKQLNWDCFYHFYKDRPKNIRRIKLEKPPTWERKASMFLQNSFFLSEYSLTNIQDLQDSRGEGEAISLTLLYHFHPLHRHLDISRAITGQSSRLHIATSRIWKFGAH